MDIREALAIRMAGQGLSRDRADVVQAARRSAGIQAQDLTASRLGLWARTAGIDQAAVTRACDTERTVARSWLMRGTLHLVPSADLRWMVGLFGPRTIARYRRRRLDLGLDDEVCRRAAEVIPELLGARRLTRAELIRALDKWVSIDPSGQAPAHLLIFLACSGLVCRGPDRGDEPTYVRLDDWVGAGDPGPVGNAAVVELARRYFAAFSPATARDFARWAGLPLRQAAAAVAELDDELRRVTIEGDEALMGWSAEVTADVWRLLPAFDNYVLGHQSRDLALDPRFGSRIHAGGGWIHPSVVHDGRVVGTWRLRRKLGGSTVEVEIFEGDPARVESPLAKEAAELGDFLGVVTELRVSGCRSR